MEDNHDYRIPLRTCARSRGHDFQRRVRVILDLRNNGGGSLVRGRGDDGTFIEAGPVVQVKERRGIQVLSDPDSDIVYAGRMIILVNRQKRIRFRDSGRRPSGFMAGLCSLEIRRRIGKRNRSVAIDAGSPRLTDGVDQGHPPPVSTGSLAARHN